MVENVGCGVILEAATCGPLAEIADSLTFNVETDIIDWTATVVVSFAMRATPEVSFRCHLDLLEMRELVGVNIQVEL